MKSNPEQLEKRGFLGKGEELNYMPLTLDEKIILLNSKIPIERTLGARLLSTENKNISKQLISALKKETKLYAKIEICKALVVLKKDSIPLLITELGKIGHNQHKNIPLKEFSKDSYPLPRDIAARTLANIGDPALPFLLPFLLRNDIYSLSEAIDAIGFICFYSPHPEILDCLINRYKQHDNNLLIQWKLIRAMSSFPESKNFLENELIICENKRLKQEMNRSLRLCTRP